MTDRRVVVQFTTDEEKTIAEQRLSGVEEAGSLLYGSVAEEGIAELEQRGLAVDVLDEGRQTQLRGATGGAPRPISRSALADSQAADIASFTEPSPIRPVDVWVLQLTGPLLPWWRAQLAERHVELLEHQGGLAFTARLALDAVPAVAALPFVESLRPYGLRDTIHPAHLATRGFGLGPEEPSTYELLVHRRDDMPVVLSWLAERQAQVDVSTDRKVRFTTSDAGVVQQLAALPEVASMYDFVRPTPSNDRARVIVGVDLRSSTFAQGVTQTGRGQLVGVADTGLDASHPDFQGRIEGSVARGRPGDASDPSGHGTHVAGSAVGSGAASAGVVRGTAPEARLFFQSLMDGNGELSGLDPSFAAVLQEAYDAGVRIHNDSWGVEGTASAYRADSLEIDEFVAGHPDMLVVIAAGNSALAANPLNVPRGNVDLLSIDAPATAKNALTVGASRSDRAPVTTITTFGQWWPRKFPDPPIANEALSGDPEAMAAFSGRGPCDDQARMKPDVVAPGTFILSTRSSIAPDSSFWAPDPSNPQYAFDGGTSMAAPIVTGCAALVRQYLVETLGHQASAALLRAILVNGTRWLSARDAVADHGLAPNYHQGFGCISLPDSIPNSGEPWLRLAFSDEWESDALAVANTGNGRRFVFQVDGTRPIRLCLVWTDPPGRSLQNCLSLRLDHSASGSTWYGNADRPVFLKSPFDKGNNVQIIRVDDPQLGTYVASVTGASLTTPPQRFALVATSSFTSELTSAGSF